MQANRPNAAKGRSRSPGREPFGAGGLSSQLNSLSLRTSPTKQGTGSTVRGASLHKKSKSATGQPVFDRSRSGSPVKQQTNSRHGSAVPLKTSPSKADARRAYGHDAFVSTSKTPSKSIIARAGLSKSLGAGTVYKKDSIVAAGGLGRMDIATKDWDGSVSAGVSPKKRSLSAKKYDRFIPSRENSGSSGATIINDDIHRKVHDSFDQDDSKVSDSAPDDGFDDSPPPTPYRAETSDQAHTAELSSSLGIELGKRILSFSAEPPCASNEHSSLLAAYARGDGVSGKSSSHATAQAASQRRRIATTAERVLDAPGLVDDYYLNLLDWSSTNLVAIALSDSVYIWNAESGDVGCLCSISNGDETSDEIVCSVRFSEDGSYLAVGTSSGPVQIYDLASSSRVRSMAGHATRVPTLSWNGAVLSSGSRDGSIWNHDVRIERHKIAEMRGHRAEVCGLDWRRDTGIAAGSGGGSAGVTGLLASGGNDNVVNVWDGRMLSAPKMVKTNHSAAVKAIAWCPWQPSLLATGGGSSDRTIHFWNTTTSARLNSLVTPSQVTSLRFNPHAREILSSHGFPDNQLSVWSFPTLTKIVDINSAHETRVLHTCLSPDGTTVATASSDENLKFWKVFDLPKKTVSSSGSAFIGKGSTIGGPGKRDDDVGWRGRTGIAIR